MYLGIYHIHSVYGVYHWLLSEDCRCIAEWYPCLCMSISLYAYPCMHAHVCMSMYACQCMFMYVCLFMSKFACLCMHVHECIFMYACLCIHVHTNSNVILYRTLDFVTLMGLDLSTSGAGVTAHHAPLYCENGDDCVVRAIK